MPRSRDLFACLALALACVAGAVESRAQSLPPPDEYHIRVFGPQDGLPGADVRGLAQTRDGYVYVAGGRRVVRFDGYGFERAPLAGAPSDIIMDMFVDRQER